VDREIIDNIQCRWCGGPNGEEYEMSSEYTTVTSCNKPECMIKTDERWEELIWAEENDED
jgi:sarcosine oxidase delta subunit